MKTLFCLKPPLPLCLPRPSQRSQRSPLLHRPTTWKLHANAKGFGSPPATAKESTTNRNANKDNGNDDEPLPQVVFERIIVRVLVSVAVPMAIGVALLYLLGTAKEQNLWDVPKWLPFLTTFLTFGASTFGVAYGSLSTSWDPDKKGSLLGLEEAQQNWDEMWKEENGS